jgi:predicted permease
MHEEMAFHLGQLTARYQREGLPPEEARRRATIDFGGLSRHQEAARDNLRSRIVEDALRDLKYGWRGLWRTPTFSIVVILMLAIGIGANGAVISIIDAAFFRKLPVPNPERIVSIRSTDWRHGNRNSFPDYRDLRARIPGVEGLAAYTMQTLPLGDTLAGSSAWSALVSGNYFATLGVRPARGRFVDSTEEEPHGAHLVVVISDAFWRSRYAGNERAVGQQLAIGRAHFTIIGVTPPGFTGIHPEGRTDLWLPYTMEAEATGRPYDLDDRELRKTFIIGRLARGAALARVQTGLDAAAHDLAVAYPVADKTLKLNVAFHGRLATINESANAFSSFAMVWAMVALLHLVACSNIASLMLARAAARRQQLGIRLCLGASRRHILMQALAEPTLLAFLGAAGGVLVARWLAIIVTRMQFMSAMDPGLDFRVVAIVALIAVATVVEFALLPALEASRHDPLTIMRGATGMRVAGRRSSGAPMLVIVQVAVSLILLANAAVMLRRFQQQEFGDPGYDAPHLLMATVGLRPDSPRGGDWSARLDELMTRVTALPGVTHAAAVEGTLLWRTGWQEVVMVAGHQYREGESRMMSGQFIGPGYFAAIGASLVRGREFLASDRTAAAHNGYDVVIVNETMAKRYWPGADPIGRQVSYHGKGQATVVGVVRDLHDVSLSSVGPRVYLPLLEAPVSAGFVLVVRTSGDPAAVRGTLRSVIVSTLPAEAPWIPTVSEMVDDASSLARVGAISLVICAAIALLLTAIGLYGLVSAWGTERRVEIGIRRALGAQVGHVHRLLVGGAGKLIAIGVVVGLAGALVAVRVERSWWGPTFTLEPLPLLLACLVLGLVAAIAAYVPSRRATAVDPSEVLHST